MSFRTNPSGCTQIPSSDLPVLGSMFFPDNPWLLKPLHNPVFSLEIHTPPSKTHWPPAWTRNSLAIVQTRPAWCWPLETVPWEGCLPVCHWMMLHSSSCPSSWWLWNTLILEDSTAYIHNKQKTNSPQTTPPVVHRRGNAYVYQRRAMVPF